MSSEQYLIELIVVKQNGEEDIFDRCEFYASNRDDAKTKAREWMEAKRRGIPKEIGAKKARWTLTKGYQREGIDGDTIKLDP